ncbi:hypothetical protein Q31b_01460 [Novipirellula aureliae]|uniref:PEP-CTERM protein-sorting domain-containing protein n=1 Tax=Novipirellula aureliae TaxID=2527966 RepID=A0A5C6E8V6_9BACT|nr:hypothetical protein [Novipirellula aureliae]TWU44975.1 hypothetical protein Q31b_01460 [Novipirellula aureliae]
MRFRLLAIPFLALALAQAPASADVTFLFDMDTGLAEIQETRTTEWKDTFDIDIWLEADAAITEFSTIFIFDPQYVTVVENSVLTPDYGDAGFEMTGRPGGFEQTSSLTLNNEGGTLGLFGGGDGATARSGSFIVGRLTLSVLNPTMEDTTESLLGFDASAADFFGAPTTVTPVFGASTLTISAVPEPSAFAFCFAGTALLTYRRRRSR